MRQGGLADAGQVVQQQVAAGQQAGQGQAYLLVLADHDFVDLACDGVQFVKHGWIPVVVVFNSAAGVVD